MVSLAFILRYARFTYAFATKTSYRLFPSCLKIHTNLFLLTNSNSWLCTLHVYKEAMPSPCTTIRPASYHIIPLCLICFWSVYKAMNASTDRWNNKSSVLKQPVVPIQRVEWVRDEEWFNSQLQKGCCPFAVEMYSKRYAAIENRCCTSRASQGKIEPLRAIGGLGKH